jgi:hypothetical protein
MANVKKGQTVSEPEWWRHLRAWKRVFWKKQRQAFKRAARREAGRLSWREIERDGTHRDGRSDGA